MPAQFLAATSTGVSSDALFFETQPGATFTQGPNTAAAYIRHWTNGPYAGLFVRYESAGNNLTFDGLGNPLTGTITTMTLLAANGSTLLAQLTGLNNSVLNLTKAGLIGGGGNTIYGRAGNDVLVASDGGDTLFDSVGPPPGVVSTSDAGNDTLLGGAGNDVIVSLGGVDSIDGGGGTDALRLDRSGSNLNFSFSLANPSVQQTLADGTRIQNIENIDLSTGGGNDSLQGGARDDGLFGNGGNDTLDGGLGSDFLDGGQGDDVLMSLAGNTRESDYIGGVGTDTLVLDRTGASYGVHMTVTDAVNHFMQIDEAIPADGWFAGGVERYNVTGGSGADTLAGMEFNDTLNGGLGADLYSAGAGDDRIVSGVGNTLEGNGVFLAVDGGAGIDTLALQRDGATGVSVTVLSGLGTISVTDVGGAWVANNTERLEFSGGTGADTVNGGSYNDSLNGGAGDDLLVGNGGADTLIGGLGNDTVNYGVGIGGLGVYVDLANGFAQDTSGDYDTLNSIEVVRGTNYFRSGALSDVMLGDGNANTFFGLGGQDYILGNGGADYIDVGAGANNIGLGGAGNDTLVGGVDVDFLYGGDGSDSITGGDGADWLIGGDYSGPAVTGADIVLGEAGNDVLSVGNKGGSFALADGGTGNDTIYGGALANDFIRGGQGSDYLYGNTGADTYRFGAGDLVSGDIDTVFTFNAGDHLSFDLSYQNHIAVVAGTNAGVSGVYLADTGSTWLAWLPYQNVAQVSAELIFV